MNALNFLERSETAADFLEDEKKRTLGQKAISFLTMGHIYGEDVPESELTAEGAPNLKDVPSGTPGFFEDPITALAFGAAAGARAAGPALGKLATAARETVGWVTGGASEIPTLAKAGAKGVSKAVSAKPLAKAAGKRQAAEYLASVTPEARVGAEAAEGVIQVAPKTVSKATDLDVLASQETAKAQSGKVGLDINKTPQPTYKFDEPETEKLYQSARGIKPETIAQKIKVVATEVGHKFTRDFEHLANKKENAQLVFDLKRLEKQKDVVADRTTRSIGETLSGMNKAEYDVFNRKVVLDDLLKDYNRGLYSGKELPFKFTPESLKAEVEKLDSLVQSNPNIANALSKRGEMWKQVQAEYIDAMSPYKSNVEDMFRDNYYRHQVLDYIDNNGIFGTGKRLRTPNKGYMKSRTGASNLYNTDYLEAEHQIMAQMLHDIETANTLTKIKSGEDIAKQVRKAAKDQGLEDWRKAIPEGYTVWQPKEGSVFHPVLTVDEKTAEKIMAGEMDEILEGGSSIFKEVLAVGGRRKEWVVRNEVAETLNNLVRERAKGLISSYDLGVMSAWKKWQLISPRRYAKYNLRNMTGDAEATFLGNPSGFKELPNAVKELGDVFFGKKPLTPEMAAWFERGGMSSTLQAQEMDTLKQMWMFSRLHDGSKLNLWNKYWKAARISTDFREAILRYANFKDYKAQLASGKLKNYGASKPEMIDALKDADDKAFWLSNDLLGAYDRVSIAGQVTSERLIPFWRWQEVNFKRYIQLYKNAANDGKLTATIGKKLGAATPRVAMKVGALAIKTAAFASTLAVYNHTFFPDEEKKLPLDVRTRPHIILGTDAQGNVEYFNRMGTLDDFISWFGLDAAPRFVNDYLSGRKTLREALVEQAKETGGAPLNKVVQGALPFTKLAGELITRKSTFPDVFKPGTIRDRYLHLARSFGLENEYIAMAGKPSRGYGESLKGAFVYKVSPGEAAYRDVYDLKADFLKKMGRSSEGFWLTPTGDALYNMKLAMKYSDKEAFSKYFQEYVELSVAQGKDASQVRQGIQTSIKAMHPLWGLNDQIRAQFVNSLNQEDQDTLIEAVKFYNEVLSGDK